MREAERAREEIVRVQSDLLALGAEATGQAEMTGAQAERLITILTRLVKAQNAFIASLEAELLTIVGPGGPLH